MRKRGKMKRMAEEWRQIFFAINKNDNRIKILCRIRIIDNDSLKL